MLKKTTKRFISIVMAAMMIISMIPFTAFAADETTASDLSGHWAENVITEWMDYGIINGYEDGTIRPNNKITRAEMTAMLDRVMDYQTKADNTFSDLGDSWYTDVILKGNAAGVISGYPDGTVKPDATITRQEAVAMFSRVLSLDTKNAPEATFTDNADVADWAKDAVNAMAAADYIHGSDGHFRPNDGITRAEVVTILNNIFDKLYQKAGEYTGDVDGSAVINTDQVTLKDMTISGDLIIAEGVGDGHVVLDNVTVDGKLIVRGGGENSVIIKGDSKINNISVERIDGAVRVAVEDNASVNAVLIDNGGQDVKIEGTIDTVNVASANVNVDITGAAKDINVADTAKNATITVTSTATADNISTSAENTTIIVAGTVSNIDIADTASNSVVTTQSSATVDKVTTAAGNTTIEGSGTVTDVVVSENASDVTVTTEGTKVENNSNSNVTTGDDSVIAPGTTDTTPGGTTETPSVPSTPSGPSHTHNYVDGVCAADGAIDPSWAQVNSTATWNEAVADGKNIVVTADFTTDAQLQITKAITVNGNGHTITAANDWTGTANENKHLFSVIGDEANNVAIKNLTLDSNNAAYGAQAYCVNGTTLTNVTLQNSKGAGLTVNGSTVTANGLTTSDNGWGGVNIDKGTGVTDNTTFTFDANSTFAEASPVYSDDATQVAVTAPEGWAKAATPGEDGKNPNKCTWYKLFTGGDGTADNPYLISNAEQFNAIENLSNDMKAGKEYFFKQTADIVLTQNGDTLCGNYNGDGHSVTSVDKNGTTYLFTYFYGNVATVENLTIISRSYAPLIVTSENNADNFTVRNLTINSLDNATIYANSNNFGFIYDNALYENWDKAGTTTHTYILENITNNVNVINTGTCTAPFIGSGPCFNDPKSSISYTNCVNNGNITGTEQVGFYYGNKAYIASVESLDQFKAVGCENNGILRAVATNGESGACNGSEMLTKKYGTVAGNGQFIAENAIANTNFDLYYQDGLLLKPSNASETNYTYKAVANISAIYWNDDYESNGIKIVLPTELIESTDSLTSLKNANFTVYDKTTALDKAIISEEDSFQYQDPVYSYSYLLKQTTDNNFVLVIDVGEDGVINSDKDHVSTISMNVYAFDGNTLCGTKAID